MPGLGKYNPCSRRGTRNSGAVVKGFYDHWLRGSPPYTGNQVLTRTHKGAIVFTLWGHNWLRLRIKPLVGDNQGNEFVRPCRPRNKTSIQNVKYIPCSGTTVDQSKVVN